MEHILKIPLKSRFLYKSSENTFKLGERGVALKNELRKLLVSQQKFQPASENLQGLGKCHTGGTTLEQFFHIQKEQKIWWMKYSNHPGKYYLSNLVAKGDNDKSVSISRHFNENVFNLETVKFTSDHESCQIQSFVDLENATLALIFDSAEDSKYDKLLIHRILAPFQVSLVSKAKDTIPLAEHVRTLLNKTSIRVDPIIKDFETLDDSDLDQIGIPFTILLDDSSLENGFMKLRNRDTSLCETIHISYLQDYLIKIIKS